MDRAIYKAINRFADHTTWAHGVVRVYAKDGIALFALLLVAGWWIGRTSAQPTTSVAAAIAAGAGALVALGVNQPIGAAIDRARPYNTIPNMHLLVDRTKDFSFASDHAIIAGGVAGGLWLVHHRLGLIAGVAAFAMAVARVYVGAHYPGDVGAGLILGAFVTIVVSRLATRPLAQVLDRLCATPLRPVITATPRIPTP